MYANCRILDLSFNKIRKLEHLDTLVNLQKLFVIHNKISSIRSLSNLSQLTMLELGDNRIVVCDVSIPIYISKKDHLLVLIIENEWMKDTKKKLK